VAPSDKPTIVIDGADNIDIDANCIDAALSQLDAASRVGLKTNAMMNRSHASIVVDLGHNIWHIDGKSKDDARPENVMLNSTLSRQNTLRIKQCLGLMRSAEHCHAWTDYTTMRRGYTPFNGTNVREPELIPTEVADTLVGDLPDKLLIDSFVLFSNPAARDILRIIDAVTALSKEPKSDDEPTKVRSHYIRALKSFVPKPPVR
jgi:hypothetical protein